MTAKVAPVDAVTIEPVFILTTAGIALNVNNTVPDDGVGVLRTAPKFCANLSRSEPETIRND
jgi:hypothetical protein